MASSVRDFYDGLAAEYHLVYGDRWDDAVARQAEVLDALIREVHGDAADVLDCSCGIGTQAIGLALRDHRVVGTDISERSLERARVEAARLDAEVSFSIADFRDLDGVDRTARRGPLVRQRAPAPPRAGGDRGRAAGDAVEAVRRRAAGDQHPRLRRGATGGTAACIVAGPPRRLVVRLHDWDAPDSPYHTVRFFFITETDDGWDLAYHDARYRALPRAELTAAAATRGLRRHRLAGSRRRRLPPADPHGARLRPMARRVPIARRGPGQSYRPDQLPPSIFGAHQPGIATPLLDHLVFAAFDVADRDPRDLLIEWSARAERLMRVHDALTLTIGLGPGSSMIASACAMPARGRSRSCRHSPATSSIPPDAAAICASRRPRTIRGARREQSRS